jgi:hypothetical protein
MLASPLVAVPPAPPAVIDAAYVVLAPLVPELAVIVVIVSVPDATVDAVPDAVPTV